MIPPTPLVAAEELGANIPQNQRARSCQKAVGVQVDVVLDEAADEEVAVIVPVLAQTKKNASRAVWGERGRGEVYQVDREE